MNGEKIECFDENQLTEREAGYCILPGLVDTHFHGCAVYDFCDGTAEAMCAIASYGLTHVITTITPAAITLSEDMLTDICTACSSAVETETLKEGIALREILKGIHLEGSFISMEKKGTQNPAYIHKLDMKMLDRLQWAGKRIFLLRIVSLILGK